MTEDERSPSPRPSPPGAGGDSIPTRASLLSRLKNWGDQASWKEFFDTYWRLIYNLARKAGLSDAEAQDIVQETILSVARKIEGFRYDPAVCSFKSWMLQLTRWRITNQLKKRQSENVRHASPSTDSSGTPDLLSQTPDPAGFDLEAIWDEEWTKTILAAALEKVKHQIAPEQFQIFDLYCLENWPVQKVARTLGVSVGRVYLTKHRVGRLLKKEVRRLEQRESAAGTGSGVGSGER